jgi:methylenetetrahydrofolate dehydrogenase (NADP+)/methenyltetrahydrofolate cyclohydrolase
VIFSRLIQAGFVLPSFQELPEFFPNTTCQILNGKKLSQSFVTQAKELLKTKSIVPRLAVILVGEDPASQLYVSNKIKLFAQAGFESQRFFFQSSQISQKELLTIIEKLNHDDSVHGILVQLPLPPHLHSESILNAISPKKDVDGFLPQNVGALALGNYSHSIACTPFGIAALLSAYGIPLAGRHAVVVGRSNIVGKPMGLLLLGADCTVTWAHSKTPQLQEITKTADILVVAAGKQDLIGSVHVKPGAVVVDVGIHKKENGKLCGDVQESVKEVASYLTPVPGGVGPMTIAMLMVNTALSAWS